MLKLPRIFAGLLILVVGCIGVARADNTPNASVLAAMAQPTGHIATTKYVRSITDVLGSRTDDLAGVVLGKYNSHDHEYEGGLVNYLGDLSTVERLDPVGSYSDSEGLAGLLNEIVDEIAFGVGRDGQSQIELNKQNVEEALYEVEKKLNKSVYERDLGMVYKQDNKGSDVLNLNTGAKKIVPAINELDAEIEGTLNAETGEREGGLKQQVTAAAQAAAAANSAADSALATADANAKILNGYYDEEIEEDVPGLVQEIESINNDIHGYYDEDAGEDVPGLVQEIESINDEILGELNDKGKREGGLKEEIADANNAVWDLNYYVKGECNNKGEDCQGGLEQRIFGVVDEGTVIERGLQQEVEALRGELDGVFNEETEEVEGGLKKQVQANTDAIQANWGQVPIKRGGEQTGTVQIWVE